MIMPVINTPSWAGLAATAQFPLLLVVAFLSGCNFAGSEKTAFTVTHKCTASGVLSDITIGGTAVEKINVDEHCVVEITNSDSANIPPTRIRNESTAAAIRLRAGSGTADPVREPDGV